MKVYEYQARDLLADAGIPVPAGRVIDNVELAATTYKQVVNDAGLGDGGLAVVKAQVHAGGRGKAGFVKLVHSPEEAEEAARFMLSNKMVSVQTGPEGLEVSKLLIAAGVEIEKEYY
ncbi:MAG: ATP-grasp domain-containing protein, partial [Planctomycetota bacterium]